jgi:hypothetical protein
LEGAASLPANLIQVFLKVPLCRFSVGRVPPLDLPESGQGAAQVRDVKIPAGVMVGEVSKLLPLGRGFNGRKGGIRKLSDVSPAPLRRLGGGSGQHQQPQQDSHRPPDRYRFPRSIPHQRLPPIPSAESEKPGQACPSN